MPATNNDPSCTCGARQADPGVLLHRLHQVVDELWNGAVRTSVGSAPCTRPQYRVTHARHFSMDMPRQVYQ